MKYSNQAILFCVTFCVIFSALSFSAEATLVRDRRCDTWGDSLSGPEAKSRVAFALSCEKDQRIIREIRASERGVIAKDGSSGIGYPSYGRFNDAISDYDNPKNWFAPPRSSGNCKNIPEGYEVAFYCAAGCYTPDQKILSPSGSIAVGDASTLQVDSVQTLTPDSSLSQLQYRSSSVLSYISDAKAGPQEILHFTLLTGGELRVTLNHPLMNSSGEMKQAQTFNIGEALLQANGQPDPIISIKKEDYFGKVYNLRLASEDLKENILIAQGYLNGSARYQNEYVNHINRQLLRSVVAAHLIQK